jgi:hypothetical protein
MKNDVLAALNREATAAIQVVADGAAEELDEGLKFVADARTELARIDGQIASLREVIAAERAKKVRELQNARAAVTAAQETVTGLQRSITNAKDRISLLKSEISRKYRWYAARPWYQKTWAWGVYAAYVAAKNAEIAANNVAIASLETAKWTAIGALEIAKRALALLQAGTENFPIEADPRMLLLIGAQENAKLVLNGAELILEGVRAAVGAAAEVGTFIVQTGLGGLLDVRSARFDASFEAARGGAVSLTLDLVFMGGVPRTVSLAFDIKNLNSIRSTAQSLATALVPI